LNLLDSLDLKKVLFSSVVPVIYKELKK